MKRSTRESAAVVAKTIADINTVAKAAVMSRNYLWFDYKRFRKTGFDELVSDICHENRVSEEHIRRVAGFKELEA
jgi:hypothetical protein